MLRTDPDRTRLIPCGGNRGLVERAVRLHALGCDMVIGIVTRTSGSTYQKAGALVLLDRHGVQAGVISGGCLEPELELKAREVLKQQQARLIEFDTRSDEDLVFGSGIGCRGRMWVLLLPQPAVIPAPLLQALVSAQHDGLALDITLEGEGETGAGFVQCAERRWRWDGKGALVTLDADEAAAPGLQLQIAASPRLVLLGGGPETPSLITNARQMGWHTQVMEHRERWSQLALHAGADHILAMAPSAAYAALRPQRFDAALVMSHNFSHDLAHLRFLAAGTIPYIGLLGPTARRDELLAELGADAAAILPRLHAPVGLRLGGQGPEAIALSIAAELQRHVAHYTATPTPAHA